MSSRLRIQLQPWPEQVNNFSSVQSPLWMQLNADIEPIMFRLIVHVGLQMRFWEQNEFFFYFNKKCIELWVNDIQFHIFFFIRRRRTKWNRMKYLDAGPTREHVFICVFSVSALWIFSLPNKSGIKWRINKVPHKMETYLSPFFSMATFIRRNWESETDIILRGKRSEMRRNWNRKQMRTRTKSESEKKDKWKKENFYTYNRMWETQIHILWDVIRNRLCLRVKFLAPLMQQR